MSLIDSIINNIPKTGINSKASFQKKIDNIYTANEQVFIKVPEVRKEKPKKEVEKEPEVRKRDVEKEKEPEVRKSDVEKEKEPEDKKEVEKPKKRDVEKEPKKRDVEKEKEPKKRDVEKPKRRKVEAKGKIEKRVKTEDKEYDYIEEVGLLTPKRMNKPITVKKVKLPRDSTSIDKYNDVDAQTYEEDREMNFSMIEKGKLEALDRANNFDVRPKSPIRAKRTKREK